MKTFFILILVVLCVFQLSIVTVAAEEEFREEYCNDDGILEPIRKGLCAKYKCNMENTGIITIGCALSQCAGKPIGFEGDSSKPYPECCIHPICASST